MKNNVKQMLGTPTITDRFVSPCGWAERETRTYNVMGDNKIEVKYSRRRGKVRITVTAYIYNPRVVVCYNGENEWEEMREWEPILRLFDENEDKMLAQAYGIVMCYSK